MIPVFSKELAARARTALARAAIARALGDAAPLPEDPFTGKPLLERSGALYSVGANRADDGGAADDIVRKVRQRFAASAGSAARTAARTARRRALSSGSSSPITSERLPFSIFTPVPATHAAAS